jgi:hypothetical protein
MKPIKLFMIVTAAALIIFGVGGYALAFHDGGVAHCDGCHTMHNSESGVSIIENGVVGTAGAHLTIGATPTETCLNCHEGSGTYHVFNNDTSDPSKVNFTPGGDFYWMKKEFVYNLHGETHTNAADNHGHNVIAPAYGLTPETENGTGKAPGGSYPTNDLHCSSCHDPHGKKINKTGPIEESGSYGADPTAVETGNYRLLGDIGYAPGPGTVVFTAKVPIATTGSPFGPLRNETKTSHTDYGQGMAEWCGNCHTDFVGNGGAGVHRHPASNAATLAGIQNLANNYNIYVKTGDTNGTSATAYEPIVSFERQITDPTLLDPTTTEGPDGNSNVMCLSCHRAHASAFPNAGRWDFETEFPTSDYHPKDSDTGAVAGDALAAYYGRDVESEFGSAQRSFCNKCHLKD